MHTIKFNKAMHDAHKLEDRCSLKSIHELGITSMESLHHFLQKLTKRLWNLLSIYKELLIDKWFWETIEWLVVILRHGNTDNNQKGLQSSQSETYRSHCDRHLFRKLIFKKSDKIIWWRSKWPFQEMILD